MNCVWEKVGDRWVCAAPGCGRVNKQGPHIRVKCRSDEAKGFQPSMHFCKHMKFGQYTGKTLSEYGCDHNCAMATMEAHHCELKNESCFPFLKNDRYDDGSANCPHRCDAFEIDVALSEEWAK